MCSPPLGKIELNELEKEIYDQLPEKAPKEHDQWLEIASKAEQLMGSLMDRGGIPAIRWEVFANPEHAELGKQSKLEQFQEHGNNDVFRHPNFLRYLRYFVEGPLLPASVIDGLFQILDDDVGTSTVVQENCCRFIRDSIRIHDLDPSVAATEFYRLALEIGLHRQDAKDFRQEALSFRKRR